MPKKKQQQSYDPPPAVSHGRVATKDPNHNRFAPESLNGRVLASRPMAGQIHDMLFKPYVWRGRDNPKASALSAQLGRLGIS